MDIRRQKHEWRSAPLRRLALASSFPATCLLFFLAPCFASGVQQEYTSGPALAYDVASIRQFRADRERYQMVIMNPVRYGRFRASGVTVKMLIHLAYGVQEDQIQGGPAWIHSDLYEVDAKADSSVDQQLQKMSDDEARLARQHMLQVLLADRFQLKVRLETRNRSLYALVLGKNGPKLHPSTLQVDASGTPMDSRFSVHVDGETMTFRETPLYAFVEFLSQQTQCEILDKTGLGGKYDFSLHFQQQPHGEAESASDSSSPSLYAALSEQLGLKLEPQKGPVETVVIDHVERPSGN
jgi:uncharacterized protein (TIGR03435 family)